MLKFKELLPEKLTNKEEKEDKKLFPKKEDYQPIKRKLLEKEKLTVKNGLKLSETMLPNLLKKVFKKTSN
jgi:hypothetical protein